jgi:hypothetical protein
LSPDAKLRLLKKMQDQHENKVIFSQDQSFINYNDVLISCIINAMQKVDLTGNMLQGSQEIVRVFTFKTLSMLLIYVTYNKKLQPCSLKTEHLRELLIAYQMSIQNLKAVMLTEMAQIVPEVLEEEFNNFKHSSMMETQLKDLDDLMSNPLIMLSQINDRQINRRIPNQLMYAKKAIEILVNKVHIFLSLRHIVNLLCGNQILVKDNQTVIQSEYAGIDVNPIAREITPIHGWEQSGSYQLPSVNVELILCNQRVGKKMCVRYVMIDPEFFILIEPDFSVQNENRIIIHQRVPLKHVESLADRDDPRNLNIGFAVFFPTAQGSAHASQGPRMGGQAAEQTKPQQQFSTQEILLYFENSSKCSYLKNMLDHNKKTFKLQQINKANVFFDKSLKYIDVIKNYAGIFDQI